MKTIVLITLLLLAACSNSSNEPEQPDAPRPETPALSDEELIDLIERNTFQFFWDAYCEQTGLYVESLALQPYPVNSWRDINASTTSVGWGLSAMCIGDLRGWKPREEILKRVLKTLNAIYNDPDNPDDFYVDGIYGGWYHMFNKYTGKRVGKWEVATTGIDLLMGGVLYVMEHFKETEAETLARKIYLSVQWNQFINEQGGVTAGWSPEKGGLFLEYTMYNEYVLFYLFGMGSPTYPLPEKSWDRWNTGPGCKPFEPYKAQGIGPFYAPGYGGWRKIAPVSFIYQMPANYIDWRGMKDKYGVDYWQSGVNGLKANRHVCFSVADPSKGDDPLLWGWNANESKDGYQGYAGEYDCTVSPSAVVASLPFIPDLALPTIRYMYEKYGKSIFTKYGFVESFSLRDRWVCPNFLGLDQGNTIVMIENYRSGDPWKKLMRNEYVQAGLKKAGFQRYQ